MKIKRSHILFQWRRPTGFVCPACGNTRCCELKGRLLFQCNHCRRQTSLTSGTIFAATKLPLTTWLLAIYPVTQSKTSISALSMSRTLGVAGNTALLIKHKLQQVMKLRDDSKPLAGFIQGDDSYWGGKKHDGNRGRGALGKLPFMAAVTIIGNVKNSLRGTFHAISEKHFHRYLAEFCYRFNRRFDLCRLIPRFCFVAVRTGPFPARVLKVAEYHA